MFCIKSIFDPVLYFTYHTANKKVVTFQETVFVQPGGVKDANFSS